MHYKPLLIVNEKIRSGAEGNIEVMRKEKSVTGLT